MRLRALKKEDAPLMLEWMHDPDVVEHMLEDFQSKTLSDCIAFIDSANLTNDDRHFAIADERDEYQGTVSLKHIRDKKAEFAIVIRKKAMGRGISKYAMKTILEYGFSVLQLDYIYWFVNPVNSRGLKFYNKNGYNETDISTLNLGEMPREEYSHFLCYSERRPYAEVPTVGGARRVTDSKFR